MKQKQFQMLKKIDLLEKELDKEGRLREATILLARQVIQESKIVIFALHRGEKLSTKKLESDMRRLRRLVAGAPKLKYTGTYKVAEQEFVEAIVYFHFKEKGTLPGWQELRVDPEYYLLGICDFASELVRTATQLAIEDNIPAVEVIKELVAQLHGELLQLNLRGELRKKADQVRWSLKNLEDLVFQAKMKRH